MNTKPTIRLVKKAARDPETPETSDEPESSPNKWSTTVRSWVLQLREKPLAESLPAFERLFKRALSEQPVPTDPAPVGQSVNGGDV
jgi:hypothetical protein